MQVKPIHDHAGSPAPGIIPDAASVHDEAAYLRDSEAPPSALARRGLRGAPRQAQRLLSRIRRVKHPGRASRDNGR